MKCINAEKNYEREMYLLNTLHQTKVDSFKDWYNFVTLNCVFIMIGEIRLVDIYVYDTIAFLIWISKSSNMINWWNFIELSWKFIWFTLNTRIIFYTRRNNITIKGSVIKQKKLKIISESQLLKSCNYIISIINKLWNIFFLI